VRPDAYFYEWPRTWDESDYALNARTKVWLHALTPKQEVSKFLCNRAILLRDIQRYDEALQALDAAERFNPTNPACPEIHFSVVQQMGHGWLTPMFLPGMPPIALREMLISIGPDLSDTVAQSLSRKERQP
jgi:hypothetical protein